MRKKLNMNKITTKWSWLLPAVVLGLTISACGGDDDDDIIDNGGGEPEQPVDPTPVFSVQLYSFERAIGTRLGFTNEDVRSEDIAGQPYWYRMTNIDQTVYKSIEWEVYPSTGQAAQGIKQLVATLADDYPATTEQIVEYLNRHVLLSAANGVWKYSNDANEGRQDWQLEFTASKRELHYYNVNEPPFADFSRYIGKDIKAVGWGTVDATGHFLNYTPHGYLDGMINSVSMFADWAVDENDYVLDYCAVQTITVELLANLDDDKVVSIGKYLRRRYGEPVSTDSSNYWFIIENYEDRANGLAIGFRGGENREQKQSSNKSAIPVVGTVYQVLYSKLK